VKKPVASKRMAYLMSGYDEGSATLSALFVTNPSQKTAGLTGTVNPPVKATRFPRDVRVTDGGKWPKIHRSSEDQELLWSVLT